jgi:type I restriction enzyme R subunit
MEKNYSSITESNNFIILDRYSKEYECNERYQSEFDLEKEFVADLRNQGYEHATHLNEPGALLDNVRTQLQNLNNVKFSDSEWRRLVENWLDKPSDNIIDKTTKVHDDYIYDFIFDDGGGADNSSLAPYNKTNKD